MNVDATLRGPRGPGRRQAQPRPKPEPDQRYTATRPDGLRRKVLVVEDDPEVQRLLGLWLPLEGFDAVFVDNGIDALDRLAHDRPCVVILDLMMPVMDGWRFREEQMRLLDPELAAIPVIIVSAVPNVQKAAEGMAPLAVLQKPFDLDDLLAALRRC